MFILRSIQQHAKWSVLGLAFLVAPKSTEDMPLLDAHIPQLDLNAELASLEPEYNSLEDLVFASLSETNSNIAGDERCLAQAIYFEARSENLEGQLAVAQVVLNRVNDKRYPSNICRVVFQNEHLPFRCQFSFACDGRSDNPHNKQAWAIARTIAHVALYDRWTDLSDASTHYHTSSVKPYWMTKLDRRVQVGQHIFYRDTSF